MDTGYVWIKCCGCVEGFTVEEINEVIDDWNKAPWRKECEGCFWDYFSYLKGDDYYGFSAIANHHNPLMSRVHTIK